MIWGGGSKSNGKCPDNSEGQGDLTERRGECNMTTGAEPEQLSHKTTSCMRRGGIPP